MSADDAFDHNIAAQQMRMFRLAERDHGLTRKVLHLETGIPLATLKAWATGVNGMGVAGFVKLARVMPDELLSLVMEPAGKFVGTCEDGDGDPAALAAEANAFTGDYMHSIAGGRMTPQDSARLGARAMHMVPIARSVARRAAA